MRGSVLRVASVDIWSRAMSTNANGEEVSTYAYARTDRGYVQPKNTNISNQSLLMQEVAGLRAVPYTHEAYIVTYLPKAEEDRIAYMGKMYHVRAVEAWPTHAHCLLEEVMM